MIMGGLVIDKIKNLLLIDVVLIIQKNIRFFFIGSLVCALLSVFIVLLIPKEYEASATLAAREKGSFDVGVLASQFSGLGAIAGLDIGGQSYEIRPELALEYLSSRQFVQGILEKHDLLPIFFAAKTWDPEKNVTVIDQDLYDAESRKWIRSVRLPKTQKPHIDEVLKKYSRVFQVRLDKKTGLVSLRYRHRSPKFAARWINLIVLELNETLQRERIAKLEKSSEYLEAEISKTPIAEIRSSLYSLLQEQKKLAMVAAVTDEFAFEIVDPAVQPYRHAYPPRALLAVILFVAFLVLQIIGIAAFEARKKQI